MFLFILAILALVGAMFWGVNMLDGWEVTP